MDKKLEARIARLERLLGITNKSEDRKYEFMKGLIGRVHMKTSDWKDMLAELKKWFPKAEWKFSGGKISGFHRVNGTDLDIKITEKGDQKLVITFSIDSRKKSEIPGLRPKEIIKYVGDTYGREVSRLLQGGRKGSGAYDDRTYSGW